VLGVATVGLALLRAVDPTEADAFSVVAVQDFDGVAVDHSYNSSVVVGGTDNRWDEQGCQQQEWCPVWNQGRRRVATDCHHVARR